jgi:hypothetical protein
MIHHYCPEKLIPQPYLPLQAVVQQLVPEGTSQLLEIGFSQLQVAGLDLPPEVQGEGGLPLLGASCDDLLVISHRGGGVSCVPVEYKCKFPFYGKDDAYLPTKQHTGVPAFYYAQLQLQMLVNRAQVGILVLSAVEASTVRLVEFSSEWCTSMLLLVHQVYTRFVLTGIEPPAEFGSSLMGVEAYQVFLALTRENCSTCQILHHCSTEKGDDSNVYS